MEGDIYFWLAGFLGESFHYETVTEARAIESKERRPRKEMRNDESDRKERERQKVRSLITNRFACAVEAKNEKECREKTAKSPRDSAFAAETAGNRQVMAHTERSTNSTRFIL